MIAAVISAGWGHILVTGENRWHKNKLKIAERTITPLSATNAKGEISNEFS